MKKIVMIQHCGTVTGSGLGLLTTAQMLRDRFEIVVYCEDNPHGMVEVFRSNGFNVKPLPAKLPLLMYYNGGPKLLTRTCLGALREYKAYVPKWKEILEKEAPDYLLVNSLVLSWMYRCVEGTKCRSIIHIREVLRSKKTVYGKKMLEDIRHFDSVWFISENEKERYGLPESQCVIVRDCMEKEFIKPSFSENDSSKNFTVLYVGGMSKLKGFPTLMKAVNYLNKDVSVVVAGNMSLKKPQLNISNLLYFGRFLNYYKSRRLYNQGKNNVQIHFIGFCDDLSKLYRECDVLVFPSYKGHQARPAFEVGFYGKPVIISDFPDTSDNIINGINGLTFNPNNAKSLADRINYLSKNPLVCKTLGEKNKQMAEARHTYETVKQSVDNYFDNGEA